eukprot:2098139-Karenia_brevis.AAC.1
MTENLSIDYLSCHVCKNRPWDLQCTRCQLGMCYGCAMSCHHCGWEFCHACQLVHMINCPEKTVGESQKRTPSHDVTAESQCIDSKTLSAKRLS